MPQLKYAKAKDAEILFFNRTSPFPNGSTYFKILSYYR